MQPQATTSTDSGQADPAKPHAAVSAGEAYVDPHQPGVARVPIASRKFRGMEAVIDAADLPLVRGKRWNWSGQADRPGRASAVWSGTGTPMARVIMGLTDPDLLVSHLNGDKLDCRRANLVVRTRSQVSLARKPSPAAVARLRPYPDPDRAGVWRVPLKGYRAYREALIDEADLPIVRGKNWNWSGRSEEGRSEGNVILATTGRTVHLHRLIAGVTDPTIRVCFANGDALDLRRENLVVRTLAEVCRASRKPATRAGKRCASTFKGVVFDRSRGKWSARIARCGVNKNFGRFDDEIAAAEAYDAAARVLFGRHAHLNFPDRPSTEQAMADARRAMDDVSGRMRARRRRQRDLERELRRAAAERAAGEPIQAAHRPSVDRGEMIPTDVARELFDVSRPVWRRWQRFGWFSARMTVGGVKMHRIEDVEPLLRRCGIVALPYPDPQRPDVYRVPLCGETGKGREALIDADAVPLVRTRRWFAFDHADRKTEVRTSNPRENLRLHQVVMGVNGGGDDDDDDACHVGHRNGDSLDCRRANLVVRTSTETHATHRKQATWCGRACTSRFKGVCWDARAERWLASISRDRVQRRLGSFRDEIAAAQKYDEAARELFGEHARLNFPDGVDAYLEREALENEAQQREAA